MQGIGVEGGGCPITILVDDNVRTARRLKKKMYYSLRGDEVPVYETDDDGNTISYTDIEGNQIPLETGETKIVYESPEEFYASISMSGGDAEAKEYGLSTEEYDATAICQLDAYPIVEGTLIWKDSEIEYDNDEYVVPSSADYTVVKCSKSIGIVKYVLKSVTK